MNPDKAKEVLKDLNGQTFFDKEMKEAITYAIKAIEEYDLVRRMLKETRKQRDELHEERNAFQTQAGALKKEIFQLKAIDFCQCEHTTIIDGRCAYCKEKL